MASFLPLLSLAGLFEASNVIGSDRLPTGYRVRFCNGCLDGNMFEPGLDIKIKGKFVLFPGFDF
jgi:hypothetical protein